ncbi:MAG: peptidoglycan-binding domain-containing protein, partial [Eubacteriales bacterium]
DVRTIQEQLNAISNNYPAISKVRVDGNFGPATSEAVETFQEIFNMPVTGIVDYPTWYRISGIYVAVTRMAELV